MDSMQRNQTDFVFQNRNKEFSWLKELPGSLISLPPTRRLASTSDQSGP